MYAASGGPIMKWENRFYMGEGTPGPPRATALERDLTFQELASHFKPKSCRETFCKIRNGEGSALCFKVEHRSKFHGYLSRVRDEIQMQTAAALHWKWPNCIRVTVCVAFLQTSFHHTTARDYKKNNKKTKQKTIEIVSCWCAVYRFLLL